MTRAAVSRRPARTQRGRAGSNEVRGLLVEQRGSRRPSASHFQMREIHGSGAPPGRAVRSSATRRRPVVPREAGAQGRMAGDHDRDRAPERVHIERAVDRNRGPRWATAALELGQMKPRCTLERQSLRVPRARHRGRGGRPGRGAVAERGRHRAAKIGEAAVAVETSGLSVPPRARAPGRGTSSARGSNPRRVRRKSSSAPDRTRGRGRARQVSASTALHPHDIRRLRERPTAQRQASALPACVRGSPSVTSIRCGTMKDGSRAAAKARSSASPGAVSPTWRLAAASSTRRPGVRPPR